MLDNVHYFGHNPGAPRSGTLLRPDRRAAAAVRAQRAGACSARAARGPVDAHSARDLPGSGQARPTTPPTATRCWAAVGPPAHGELLRAHASDRAPLPGAARRRRAPSRITITCWRPPRAAGGAARTIGRGIPFGRQPGRQSQRLPRARGRWRQLHDALRAGGRQDLRPAAGGRATAARARGADAGPIRRRSPAKSLRECELVVNVFDGGPKTKVTYEIGGRSPARVPMQRTAMADPYIAQNYSRAPRRCRSRGCGPCRPRTCGRRRSARTSGRARIVSRCARSTSTGARSWPTW